jgi:hypothetical protein
MTTACQGRSGRPQRFARDRPAKLGNTPDVPPGPAGFPCMCTHNPRRRGTRWQPVSVPGAETTTESLKPVVAADVATDALRPLVPQVGAGRQKPCNGSCDRSNQ